MKSFRTINVGITWNHLFECEKWTLTRFKIKSFKNSPLVNHMHTHIRGAYDKFPDFLSYEHFYW